MTSNERPPVDEQDKEERSRWLEWLVETWQENEARWVEEGLLSYESVEPWTFQLRHDPRLRPRIPEGRWDRRDDYTPLHLSRAGAGHSGLYWKMIPLYDVNDLQKIWWSMKEDLHATSVFNLAAGPTQDKHLWKRLEERFQLRHRRMSRYQYLIRYREQKVLEWTRDDGKTLDEIAQLLADEGLHPLDAAGPSLTPPLSPSERHANFASARQVAVRIRIRLHKEGVLDKLPPGRPRRQETDEQ